MTKTIIFHAWDAVQAKKDGKKLTWTDLVIMLRSKYTHLELQFADRGGVSFSSTMADDANGCRFKYIDYSNPKRWKSIVFVVSDTVEQDMWAEACWMADLHTDWQSKDFGSCTFTATVSSGQDVFASSLKDITIYQGENHTKYDKAGLMYFTLERSGKWYRDIIRGLVFGWTLFIQPDPVKVWCSEACLKVWNKGQISPKIIVVPTEIDPELAIEELEKLK
jgi:hypothetical protein